MKDGWHRFEKCFPGLTSDTLVDEFFFLDGKRWGRVQQFYSDGSASANDWRGRIGAMVDVAAAKQAVEQRVLRVVKTSAR